MVDSIIFLETLFWSKILIWTLLCEIIYLEKGEKMKNIKTLSLIIIIPFIIVAIGLGSYFLSFETRINRNIIKIEDENEIFYNILSEENVDIDDYILYEEIFVDNGVYYLIFTEAWTTTYEDGDLLQAIMLRVETYIDTEYNPSINLVMEDSNYILPSLWMAGGGSALNTSRAFLKRAELRRLLVENNMAITQESITIRIEDSHCLGKLEL
jgi:hypothetical protein